MVEAAGIQPNIPYSPVLGQDSSPNRRFPNNCQPPRLTLILLSPRRRAPYLDGPALCPRFHNPLRPVPTAAIMTPAGSCLLMHLSPSSLSPLSQGFGCRTGPGTGDTAAESTGRDQVDTFGRNKVLGVRKNARTGPVTAPAA